MYTRKQLTAQADRPAAVVVGVICVILGLFFLFLTVFLAVRSITKGLPDASMATYTCLLLVLFTGLFLRCGWRMIRSTNGPSSSFSPGALRFMGGFALLFTVLAIYGHIFGANKNPISMLSTISIMIAMSFALFHLANKRSGKNDTSRSGKPIDSKPR
jgi:hypothetical protein